MKPLSKHHLVDLFRDNIIFEVINGSEEYGDEIIEEAISFSEISELKAGQKVFKQGDPGDSIVLLLRGEVGVSVSNESRNDIVMATIKENQFFGEMALIDGTDRMATVTATSDCLIGVITSDDFWAFSYKHPLLGKNLLRGLNQRLRETGASYIEKLKKEKDEVIRFNTELERKVTEKTEQLRQKDLQLIEMDRIAGIGTLAAGIAHEINNPLGFVKSSAGFLKKSLDKMIGAARYWEDKPVPEPLLKDYNDYLARINFDHLANSLDLRYDRVQRGIERIMKIVNSLRSFSRVDQAAAGKIDINRSIEEVIEILSSEDTKDLEFVREFEDLPVIECYPNEINQCLLHVLNNALDAVDRKGLIRLTTSYVEKEKNVVIRVVDDGKGMSPEVLNQAFNPFFTTKDVGSGTGVGLSMTERILNRHGGKIDISSEEGEGTAVTIILPAIGDMCKEQQ